MICVIGSGPAGVAAAYPLVKAGHQVLMLDVGLELEPELRAMVNRMAATDKHSWRSDDLGQLRLGMKASRAGVMLKRVYGSDFPYRNAAEEISLQRHNAGLLPSFALGGLSNAWGGALLSNCQRDMADWPVSQADLAPHYEALHEFMPLSGCRDELERAFPLYTDPVELPLSQQAALLLQDLRKQPVSGLAFGQSRLAVNSDCVACGLCLYGCPYGLIYNSAATVAHLQTQPNFSYQAATLVHRIEESEGQAVIHGKNRDGRFSLKADAVFLAAGTLPTSRIMLESMQAYDHSLQLSSSQYFLFPLLRRQRSKDVARGELHTLAQLFLEISDPALSPYTIHLQGYSYNDLYRQAAETMLGPLSRLLPLEMILERLILFQGYLHSASSPSLQLTLTREGLKLTGESGQRLSGVVGGIMKKLRPFGLPFSPKIGMPGEGFHAGGSLPMRQTPGPFETDVWGRPSGFERVHIVDASVMPSIPATTITYTAMANAHRIAAEYRQGRVRPARGKRCAITGANGYVGGVIAGYLRRQGYEVVPLVRRPAGPGRKFSLEEEFDGALLQGIDCLVHAAYDFSPSDPAVARQINVEGSRRLFSAAGKAGVRRMIFISSLSAFEECRSNYGRTKLEIESIARACGAVIIRPGLVFGQQSGGMVAALRQLAARRVVPLVGNGRQQLYLSHQDDLAALVDYLLKIEALSGGAMAAAAAEPVTMKELITRLAARQHLFLPVPAKLVFTILRLAETSGFTSRLRSDSLLTLLHPPPPPDFTPLQGTGITFRPL